MKIKNAFLFVLAAVVLSADPAGAAGPLANCSSGQPYRWGNGGVGIPFNPDQGTLGPLDNAGAVAPGVRRLPGLGGRAVLRRHLRERGTAARGRRHHQLRARTSTPTAPDGLLGHRLRRHRRDLRPAVRTRLRRPRLRGAGVGRLAHLHASWRACPSSTGPSFGDATRPLGRDGPRVRPLHRTWPTPSVNGQIFLRRRPRAGRRRTTPSARPASITVIETMYPFYFGPGSGTATPAQGRRRRRVDALPGRRLPGDPRADRRHRSSPPTARRGSPGSTSSPATWPIPSTDAVSASRATSRTDDRPVATRSPGPTAAAASRPAPSYAVYVDQILAGGFSTPPISLPGPEEFYNGAAESNNVAAPTIRPSSRRDAPRRAATGSGSNIVFNAFAPGDPLPVGDDGSVSCFPTVPLQALRPGVRLRVRERQRQPHLRRRQPGLHRVGGPELLGGPPRIAGLWDDLNPAAGGASCSFAPDLQRFTVTLGPTCPSSWERRATQQFSITLKRGSTRPESNTATCRRPTAWPA